MEDNIIVKLDNGFEVQIEQIEPNGGLDAEVYLFKVKGPDDTYFTYEFQFSGTLLNTAPDQGGFANGRDKIEEALKKTKELINKGEYRDLIIPRSTVGYGKLQKSNYPLRKHNDAYNK